jgi:Trypsin-like peptidase domain
MTAWFEDLPLDFTKQETKAAERLLVAAFPTNDAVMMFAESVGLNVAALNQNVAPLLFIRRMLGQARLSDRLAHLIAEVLADPSLEAVHPGFMALIKGHEGTLAAAMMRRKPSLATLAALPPSVEVWGREDAAAKPLAAQGLEKIVNVAAGFADPAVFRLRLAEAEVKTARIDIGGHAKGSGFLVADSFLLTNWHVVKGGVDGAVAVFDNQVSALGVQNVGRSVKFAENWLIASSAYAPVSQEISPDGPPAGSWDFALVRLAEPVGAQGIGPAPQAKDADLRGRYQLDGNAYVFNEAEPIFILGHPDGRPAQFSYASPSGAKPTKHASRVRYGTNTEGGSSGSPVFNRDWRVVALHHAAGPTEIPGDFNFKTNDFNQGIPIREIVGELKKQLAGKPELNALGLA